MKKVIVFIALNSIALTEGLSQGFSHIYQAPLLLNPSFAGSTGGSRFAAVTNFGTQNGNQLQNNYISFDHLLKKNGIGLGGAVYNLNGVNSYSSNYSLISKPPQKYNTIGVSFSIAPKFVLNKRNGDKRATISPSLGFGYSESNGITNINRYYIFNSSIYGNDANSIDPGSIYDGNQYNKDLKLSAGLLYNSEKLILGFVFSERLTEKSFQYYNVYNDSSSANHNHADPNSFGWSMDSNGNITTGIDTTTLFFTKYKEVKQPIIVEKKSFQTFDFHLSKIFKIGSSKFSVVPAANLGIAHQNGNSNNLPRISVYKGNISFALNYGKVLLGIGGSTGLVSNFIFAGYKTDKFKIMGSYNFQKYSNTKAFELSVNCNLKFKKR